MLTNVGIGPILMTKQQSAVSPKKPIFQDYIICLEDGCKPQDVEAAYKIILRYVADDYRLTIPWLLPVMRSGVLYWRNKLLWGEEASQ